MWLASARSAPLSLGAPHGTDVTARESSASTMFFSPNAAALMSTGPFTAS